MMDHYQPENVTLEAQKVAREMPLKRQRESEGKFSYRQRYPHPKSIKPEKGRRLKLDSKGVSTLVIGNEFVDLSQVEQLVESSQTRAIGYALYQFSKIREDCFKKKPDMADVLDYLENKMNHDGLDFLAPPGRTQSHNISRPRRYEIAAAMNRLRTLRVDS